jgi:HlyD family secretion protein
VKNKWKIVIGVVVLLLLVGGILASVKYSQRGVVTVQTSKVTREDLTSIVTASGEIKPKNYISIGANAMGELSHIYVKEGDRVRKSQLLASVENTQPRADVDAQKAALTSAEADAAASEAGYKAGEDNVSTMQAGIDRAQSDLEKAKLDFDRSKLLFDQKLIARQDFDTKKAAFDSAVASLAESKSKLVQAKSQLAQMAAQDSSAQRHIAQQRASLSRIDDVLKKYNSYSPLDGVVTNLPVKVGETVVPGIQSSTASTIMTIADMSVITAEIRVDETDIVNVKLGQQAEVTIDALPNKTFKGHVTEIGDTAILRSTGVAASQSTTSTNEAKDFKVVIALDNPPDEVRPGLSCTAKVTTATEKNTLGIPIQALTTRTKGDLEMPADGKPPVTPAKIDPAAEKAKKEELQGVFIVQAGKAQFKKVDTGITGTTDIQVTSGLKEGDEIITGSFQVIRTIRNAATVKVDNKPPVVKPAT